MSPRLNDINTLDPRQPVLRGVVVCVSFGGSLERSYEQFHT